MSTESQLTKLEVFRELLLMRIRQPIGDPKFYIYFALITLLYAPLGLYSSIISDLRDPTPFNFETLEVNLATYYMTILGAACFALINSKAKILKGTMDGLAILLLTLGFFALIASYLVEFRISIWITGAFIILSLLMWWIANADNTDMNEDTSIEGITGGNVEATLLGDLRGYNR